MYSIEDRNTGRKFLVDTGADLCLLPASPQDRRAANRRKAEIPELSTANTAPLDTFGVRTIPLCFGKRRFNQVFVLADVPKPILDMDFFKDNSIGIDAKGE